MSRRPAARQGRVRPLGEALAPVLRPLLKDRPAAEAALLLDWPAVVGAETAARCRPLRVRFPSRQERRGGLLELACDGGAALELQHRAPQLIERVNSFLGYPAIARLSFDQRQGAPAAAPPAAKSRPALAPLELPPTGHPPLDLALGRLGAALRGRRRHAGK